MDGMQKREISYYNHFQFGEVPKIVMELKNLLKNVGLSAYKVHLAFKTLENRPSISQNEALQNKIVYLIHIFESYEKEIFHYRDRLRNLIEELKRYNRDGKGIESAMRSAISSEQAHITRLMAEIDEFYKDVAPLKKGIEGSPKERLKLFNPFEIILAWSISKNLA